jgi:hypothetical protein
VILGWGLWIVDGRRAVYVALVRIDRSVVVFVVTRVTDQTISP